MGFARGWTSKANEYYNKTRLALQTLNSFLNIGAVVTGGYKGEGDNVYGITRSGHEAAVVDGHLWGDDSMALVGVTDIALVFIRGTTHQENENQMGRWTEVELAHLKAQGVPYILLDIDQSETQIHNTIQERLQELGIQKDHDSKLPPPIERKSSEILFDHNNGRWVRPEEKVLIEP